MPALSPPPPESRPLHQERRHRLQSHCCHLSCVDHRSGGTRHGESMESGVHSTLCSAHLFLDRMGWCAGAFLLHRQAHHVRDRVLLLRCARCLPPRPRCCLRALPCDLQPPPAASALVHPRQHKQNSVGKLSSTRPWHHQARLGRCTTSSASSGRPASAAPSTAASSKTSRASAVSPHPTPPSATHAHARECRQSDPLCRPTQPQRNTRPVHTIHGCDARSQARLR